MNLLKKGCIACREGTQALSAKEAVELLKQLSGWEISRDGKWLQKSYKFKNFVQAIAFVNRVGDIAEQENHHPDIKLGWGYADISLQTHAAGGLHENDFIVAAKIDLPVQ